MIIHIVLLVLNTLLITIIVLTIMFHETVDEHDPDMITIDIDVVEAKLNRDIRYSATSLMQPSFEMKENVEFTGLIKVFGDLEITDSTIFGYSFYRDLNVRRTHPIPALHIRDQNDPNISIINTDIICATLEGGRPIVLENINNETVNITGCIITTGGHEILNVESDVSNSYWNYYNFESGLAGILIVNCNSFELDLSQSSTTGGGGAVIPNAEERNPSGPGIKVLDSNNITIRNGSSHGQTGITGGIKDLEGFRIVQSSDGGNGMDIINSNVRLINVDLVPGNRGKANPQRGVFAGKDGVPFFRDASSTVSFETGVLEWPVY